VRDAAGFRTRYGSQSLPLAGGASD
jgi:hypothetical protein